MYPRCTGVDVRYKHPSERGVEEECWEVGEPRQGYDGCRRLFFGIPDGWAHEGRKCRAGSGYLSSGMSLAKQ